MEEHLGHARTINAWNAAVAVLLFISPFVFAYATGTASSIDDYIVAIVVFVLAGIRYFMPRQNVWASWVNLVLGIWLVISPFVFLYTNLAAIWMSIIAGLVIGILSIASANETQRYLNASKL